MKITAKERERRSKLRQETHAKLEVWHQRLKDMEIAKALGETEVLERISFIEQEIAKANEEMRVLDRGLKWQRAWANGRAFPRA